MSCHPLGAWLFGKVPAHGDFVARGLDMPMRDALDDWLSREVADARDVHGAEFEARFDQAPLVKFIDQDADGRLAGGALCASVDSVGRRFPLMTAIPAPDFATARAAADTCENAIYATFADRLDADTLHRQLGPAGAGEAAQGPDSSHWWVDSAEGGDAIWARAGRFPKGMVTELLRIAL